MEQDITYEKQASNNNNNNKMSDDEASRREGSDNSLSVMNRTNPPPETQENFYYDELDRKCTLKKSGTIGSKIILHRRRTHYKGKRLYDISIALLGIIGIILLILYIVISARGGWSKSRIQDVDSGNRIALLLQAIFIIFISAIGLLGSLTYWKPIILMTTLLSGLAFISHTYVAKQFLDITRFTARDMALPWWDTYTDEEIMGFQEEFHCCGYLNHLDHAFVSSNCPSDLVLYQIPEEIYYSAKVKKNDSYAKKSGVVIEDNSQFTTNTAAQTTDNTVVANQTYDDTAVAGNTDEVAGDDGVGDEGAGDEGAGDEGNGDDEGDGEDVWRKKKRSLDIDVMTGEEQSEEAEQLQKDIAAGLGRISRVGKDAVALPALKKRGLAVIEENMSDEVIDQIGEDIKNSLSHGQGKILVDVETDQKRKRYEPVFSKRKHSRRDPFSSSEETTTTTPVVEEVTPTDTTPLSKRDDELVNVIPGCRNAIVDKVKSGITPLYIVLFIFLIVYILVFISSIIYWLDLRNEKEYDEFS